MGLVEAAQISAAILQAVAAGALFYAGAKVAKVQGRLKAHIREREQWERERRRRWERWEEATAVDRDRCDGGDGLDEDRGEFLAGRGGGHPTGEDPSRDL